MGTDLPSIQFSYTADGDRRPETLDELVAAWVARASTMIANRTEGIRETVDQFAGDPNRWSWHAVDELCEHHPDVAWALILAVIASTESRDVHSLLAVGPLTDLLSEHGEVFIDTVEQQARNEPKFKHALGAAWQNAMPDAVWARVERAWQGD